MFDVGLVFNIRYTQDELEGRPSWTLFNKKITDGLASLPAEIQLPPRPASVSESVNTILWTFVEVMIQAVRNHPGRKKFHLVPPQSTPTRKWTLQMLTKEFSVENPISGLEDAPVPQRLIIIGVLHLFFPINTCI
jgi:hypothetical protein